MKRCIVPTVACLLAALTLLPFASSSLLASDKDAIQAQLDSLKREAGSIPGQAAALAEVAWPDVLDNPPLSAAARAELVTFGRHSYLALNRAMSKVQPRYTADVTATLLHARKLNLAELPPYYLPALEDAVWYGSTDARRLAIPELAVYKYGPALMACIDAALEDPGLLALVIRQTARFADDRARFFLGQVLVEGPDDLRADAATSLAAIGGEALMPLRDAVLSVGAPVRHPAIRALTPVATFDDLSVLYEYVARFGEDDKELVEMVRERATMLEIALEQQLDEDSATPSDRP